MANLFNLLNNSTYDATAPLTSSEIDEILKANYHSSEHHGVIEKGEKRYGAVAKLAMLHGAKAFETKSFRGRSYIHADNVDSELWQASAIRIAHWLGFEQYSDYLNALKSEKSKIFKRRTY